MLQSLFRTLAVPVTLFALCAELPAQPAKPTLLVLPFETAGIDSLAARTATTILRSQLGSQGSCSVVPESRTPDSPCAEADCARAAAGSTKSNQVVFGTLNRLGTKVVVEYSLVDCASGNTVASGTTSSESVEGLEETMRWIAAEIETRPHPPAGISSGSLPGARPGRALNAPRYTAVAIADFGEMYTVSGYNDTRRAFVVDGGVSFEYPTYSFDIFGGWRLGPMVNIGASYFMLPGETSPFVGAGVGYSFIAPDLWSNPFIGTADAGSSRSSFNMILKAGVVALRTNEIRLGLNIQYMEVFTGHADRALVVTLGVQGLAPGIRF
ncbi:MAG TPA: hypothetical protein VHI13_01065 [Candidatus Kapabacteria bacterium]|nr:hypothetical protein [Candidatus Kapabacteria bacterium]